MINIKQKLFDKAEKDYKKFSSSLIPNCNNILGVRLPTLRKMAKEIYKSSYRDEFLKSYTCEFMEETMLQGMVTGFIENDTWLDYVKLFIPKIDNWSVCDSFCSGLKNTKKNKEKMWNFIQPYFKSKKEFEIRFAYVMLLMYFIDDKYTDTAIQIIDKFRDNRYYAQTACAWAISICYIKYPEKTLNYLKISKLDKRTFNKSIQKIRESARMDLKTKAMLKTLIKD